MKFAALSDPKQKKCDLSKQFNRSDNNKNAHFRTLISAGNLKPLRFAPTKKGRNIYWRCFGITPDFFRFDYLKAAKF